MTPTWILDLVGAVMLVVAALSAARLVVARPWRPDSVIIDVDVAHLLMSIAMAGMLAPSLSTFPNSVWEIIFGLLTVFFAFRVVRDARASGVRALAGGHCAPHLVHSGSMLYMFLALGPAAGMTGMAGMSGMAMQTLRYPTLAFAFVLVLIGYTIWDIDQLSGKRYSPRSTRAPLGRVASAVPAMVGAESATSALPGPPAGPVTGDAAVADGADDAGPLTVGPQPGQGCADGGSVSAAGGSVGEFLLSPAVTVGCRVAMGVAMAFMLLIAI